MKFDVNIKAIYLFICLLLIGSSSSEAQSSQNKSTDVTKLEKSLSVINEANALLSSDTTAAIKIARLVNLEEIEIVDSNYQKLVKAKINFTEQAEGPAKAETTLILLIQNTKQQKEESKQIFLREVLAQMQFENHHFEGALEQIEILNSYYLKESLQEKLGELVLRKSIILYAQGEYIQSIEEAFKAIDYFEESNETKHLAFSYLQIGSTYLYINFLEQAEEYYELAGENFLKFGDTLGYAICESNIALAEYEMNHIRTAISILTKNLPILEKSDRKIVSSFAYQSLSDCYLKLENFDSAAYFINRSFKLDNGLQYATGLEKDYLVLAQIAYHRKNYQEAEAHALNALEQLKIAEDFEIESEVCYLLANVYGQVGNFIESNKYLRKHIALFDSLEIENNLINKISHQENDKLKETEFELELAINKEELQQKENNNQLNIIKALAIVLVILIIGLIVITMINRKNINLNEELIQNKKIIEEELNINRSLLQEIHHRVKNNLQIISSMLSIQSQYIKNKELEKILDECRGRISSMSLIHESLYKSEQKRNPRFDEYVKELIPRLIETYQVDENQINLILDVEQIELSLDESLPCGLIINEVVSNSIKHAFPDGRNGNITIALHKKNNAFHLKIADDGIGISQQSPPENQGSFGYLLIYTLADQLEAKVVVDSTNGLSFEFFWEND